MGGIPNSSFLAFEFVLVMNLQIKPLHLRVKGKAPVNGPAGIANDDIPQEKIKKGIQQRPHDEDRDEPTVENKGQHHNQGQHPEAQFGIEILLAVKFGASADAAAGNRPLGVQFAAARGFPALGAAFTGNETCFRQFIKK